MLDGVGFDAELLHEALDGVREELVEDVGELVHHLADVLDHQEQELAVDQGLNCETPQKGLFVTLVLHLEPDVLKFLVQSEVYVTEVVSIFDSNVNSVVETREHIASDALDHKVNFFDLFTFLVNVFLLLRLNRFK